MNDAPVGVFDSGVGGVSTLSACFDLLPDENFVYLADRSGMPYGGKSESEIEARVNLCVETLIKDGVKAIVVACNTATNVGIARLRERYKLPFVGVEPAIKPAVAACKRGNILVLLTAATSGQKKFLDLLKIYDNGKVIVAPQDTLASAVEDHIDDFEALRNRVYDILSRYHNVEGVVLGCTHYVFLRPLVNDFYGGRVRIFDGNDGAARRLKAVLSENGIAADGKSLNRKSLKFTVI